MLVRWIAALAAFVVVILIGIVAIGNFGTGIDPRTSSTPRARTRSR